MCGLIKGVVVTQRFETDNKWSIKGQFVIQVNPDVVITEWITRQ